MEDRCKLPDVLINAKVEEEKKVKICKTDALGRKRRCDEKICIENKTLKIKRK